VKFSAQSRRSVFFLCVALLAAGVFARALEIRLSHYRDDPSPTHYITEGARLAEFRLDKLDVPVAVETSAILTPRWIENHTVVDFEVPVMNIDWPLVVPHLRGPPSLSI
jgi:hypothetical protein